MTTAEREIAERQTARAVLMIRPAAFGANEVTRPSNRFQSSTPGGDPADVARVAAAEFDALAARLKLAGVTVHAFGGRTTSTLPDEVFPNNWISTHADGTVVFYPLMAWNRRPERRRDVVDELQQRASGYRIDRLIDLSDMEREGHFLEGTGSVVLDRVNRVGYACLSPRTHVDALKVFAKRLGYGIVTVAAHDRDGHAIYHTNVMLSIGERFAVVCLAAIDEIEQRYRILRRLEMSGREVIDITLDQLHAFAGNLLELDGGKGRIIALSERAAASLTEAQLAALRRYGELVTAKIDTIETHGGGSVRCMLAEIFLPGK